MKKIKYFAITEMNSDGSIFAVIGANDFNEFNEKLKIALSEQYDTDCAIIRRNANNNDIEDGYDFEIVVDIDEYVAELNISRTWVY